MKLIKFVNAYMALGVLSKIPLPANAAYAVYKLRRDIEPTVHFFKNEELKLADKYGAKNGEGALDIRSGRLMMRGDTEDERTAALKAYTAERDKLCAVEDEAVRAVPLIKLPRDIMIAPEIFEALAGFAAVEVDNAE
jgi:hypothetical protein